MPGIGPATGPVTATGALPGAGGVNGIGEELGLPRLRPQSPRFGSAAGSDWLQTWDDAAKRAAEGR